MAEAAGLEPTTKESKSFVLPLHHASIYGPESWNRTNDVTTTEIGIEPIWAITPLYHFSLSPYQQGTF